jgi:hypothetical protein
MERSGVQAGGACLAMPFPGAPPIFFLIDAGATRAGLQTIQVWASRANQPWVSKLSWVRTSTPPEAWGPTCVEDLGCLRFYSKCAIFES